MTTRKAKRAKVLKYLTARQLGITSAERKWLIRAGEMLLTMKPGQTVKIEGDGLFQFDMSTAGKAVTCGTAGCIAGLAHLLARTAGEQLFKFCYGGIIKGESAVLNNLFYPKEDKFAGYYSSMTPAAAGKATLNFLRTGKSKFPRNWKAKV